MRRAGKVALGMLATVALIPVAGASFMRFARPRVAPPAALSIERTPERLARGTYLMEHVLSCRHCHSDHDVERFGMPIKAGLALSGGILLDRSFGLPGVVQPPNITPDPDTGIGRWTDGEVVRAIREGIHRDGRALFPMMPSRDLGALGEDDLNAVVVYLRAQAPVRRQTAPVEVDFPVSLFIRMVPIPVAGPVAAPADATDHLAYGAYLVRIAGCKGCHTPMERGRLDESLAFAGGREFPVPTSAGRFRSVTANITSDPDAFFGRATKEGWIALVRSYAEIAADPPPVAHGYNTMMPWLEYSGMTDQDLGAIYDFMRTVPAVHRTVNPYPDAPG